jgi:rubredoxin
MNDPNPLRLRCENCNLLSTPEDGKTLGFICPNCGETNFEAVRDVPMCDFCCAPNRVVVASFPATSFNTPIAPGIDANSRDWWAACDECYHDVQNGDRQALAERSAQSAIDKGEGRGIPRSLLVSTIRELHDQFWTNRQVEGIYHGEVPAWPDK